MLTRVGDLAQNNRMTGYMLQTQTHLRTTNEQIASGTRAKRYEGLGSDAALFVRTDSALQRTSGFVAENQRLSDRAAAMDTAMSDMIDMVTRLRTLLIQRLDATTGANLPLDVEAEAMTEQLASLLNRNVDGRFLFAGSKTTGERPVQLPGVPMLTADQAAYYKGDELRLAARVDIDVTLTYGVHAGEAAFAQAFAALGNAKEGHQSGDRTMLATALDFANAALDDMIRRRADLNTTTARIESITASQESSLLYLKNTLSDLNDTDIPMAMSRMALHQVALEASFATMAKLSRLTLTEYLR
ncbi:MAG: hypothetical protein EA356_08780 [Geminicoccaceae bacterium]|nr:MAG: hypothetical protein EA356_08780 [Geminicoccaceae bacterium]